MNFWQRVEFLLEDKDISKKELAYHANFSAANISKGIEKNSVPAADTALRIAKFLHTSVEYLVNGKCSKTGKIEKSELDSSQELSEDEIMLKKYGQVISALEKMPAKRKNLILGLIEELNGGE